MNRGLHARLLATYVLALVAGLLAFAAVATLSIHRALQESLDTRLAAAGNAALAFVDARHAKISVDDEDRRQFLKLLGVQLDGAMLDSQGRVIISDVSIVPAELMQGASSGVFSVGAGEQQLRGYAVPIEHEGIRVGTVLAWRANDYIGDITRNTAIAFGLAALMIAVIAFLVGNVVTQRALAEAFARQRRFTADASHELRAPLAVITAEADLALSRRRGTDAYIAALRAIHAEARRIDALLVDLLAAARNDDDAIRCERVDVAAMLDQMASRLRAMIEGSGKRLSVRVPADSLAVSEERSLQRALLAVVHNASKFAASTTNLDVHASTAYLDIAVSDDGPGFSDNGLSHAAERFWQEDGARTGDGTGLGLAIASSVVEACGGRLFVQNGSQGGAVVTLRLRRAR